MNPTLELIQSFDAASKLYRLKCKHCNRWVIMYPAGSKDHNMIREQARIHMSNSPECVIINPHFADYTVEEPL